MREGLKALDELKTEITDLREDLQAQEINLPDFTEKFDAMERAMTPVDTEDEDLGRTVLIHTTYSAGYPHELLFPDPQKAKLFCEDLDNTLQIFNKDLNSGRTAPNRFEEISHEGGELTIFLSEIRAIEVRNSLMAQVAYEVEHGLAKAAGFIGDLFDRDDDRDDKPEGNTKPARKTSAKSTKKSGGK